MPSGTRDTSRTRYVMERDRVERLYVEEFTTFQEAKALKAGDKVKSGLEAEHAAQERVFVQAE